MTTLSALFEEQARLNSQVPALLDDEGEVSYADLNSRANRLARLLVQRNIGPDQIVAVALPKCAELIVVLLAVTKSGAAYLPIDPSYPAERVEHMLSDAAPVLLITMSDVGVTSTSTLPLVVVDSPETMSQLSTMAAEDLEDDERTCAVQDGHLLYVIYTSGSTGTPKGVAVTHTGLDDLVRAQRGSLDARPGHRVLQWSSISFDAAFWDITTALLSGATLVVVDQRHLYPGHTLTDTLRRHRVTHAVLPPVALTATDPSQTELVAVMSTGDTCTRTLVSRWAQGRRMYNGYGPTETTVGATLAGPLDVDARVTIGRPWAGTEVYVLDDKLERRPPGESGELYVSSAGLARGYLRRAGLTAARFVADPFGPPGGRLYRTGDLGYVDEDGELMFVGRNDHQVKVRGHRVELGEVEAALTSVAGVAIAVVTVRGTGLDAGLVGHVVAESGTLDSAQVLASLSMRLPKHLVPERLDVHDRLPTTPNGKIDRLRLGAAMGPATEPQIIASPQAPSGGSLTELCRIVCEVLDRESVDPADNFFRCGGNSILATRLVRRVSTELGAPLRVRAVFEASDLTSLATVIDDVLGSR
jgi:amino acid adenylation domain-containing protein